jgi:hypothetical protein
MGHRRRLVVMLAVEARERSNDHEPNLMVISTGRVWANRLSEIQIS